MIFSASASFSTFDLGFFLPSLAAALAAVPVVVVPPDLLLLLAPEECECVTGASDDDSGLAFVFGVYNLKQLILKHSY